MVPTEELPPEMLLTRHVTEVFEEPVTVAANCCVWPRKRLAVVGWTATETGGGGGTPREVAPAHAVRIMRAARAKERSGLREFVMCAT